MYLSLLGLKFINLPLPTVSVNFEFWIVLWENCDMSAAVELPDLREYVTRLTPKQERHLRLVISDDNELPPLSAAETNIGSGTPRKGLRSLIGAITDGPSDLRTNANAYLQERAARHGIVHA
jgi:hypothetical protein